MQHMRNGAQGLGVLMDLNRDRLISAGMILAALSFAAWISAAL